MSKVTKTLMTMAFASAVLSGTVMAEDNVQTFTDDELSTIKSYFNLKSCIEGLGPIMVLKAQAGAYMSEEEAKADLHEMYVDCEEGASISRDDANEFVLLLREKYGEDNLKEMLKP